MQALDYKDLAMLGKDEVIRLYLELQQQHVEAIAQKKHLQESLKLEKMHSIKVQQEVEQEEELIVNRLMRQRSDIRKKKETLQHAVEQEESFIANTIQKRLQKVLKEKADLECRLESEQSYIVDKLQTSLDLLQTEKRKLGQEKIDLENQLEAEQEYIVHKLQKEVNKLNTEKQKLYAEKADLAKQVSALGESVARLGNEKVCLEQAMEVEEEQISNRLTRQLNGMHSIQKQLEERLQRNGIEYRDIPDYDTMNYEMFVGRSPTHSDSSMSTASLRNSFTHTHPFMHNLRKPRSGVPSSTATPTMPNQQ